MTGPRAGRGSTAHDRATPRPIYSFDKRGVSPATETRRADGKRQKVSPIGALVGLSGAALFARGALNMRQHRPRLGQALLATAALGGVSIVAALLGVLEYRHTSLAATVLGPIPILMALFRPRKELR